MEITGKQYSQEELTTAVALEGVKTAVESLVKSVEEMHRDILEIKKTKVDKEELRSWDNKWCVWYEELEKFKEEYYPWKNKIDNYLWRVAAIMALVSLGIGIGFEVINNWVVPFIK